LFLGFIIFIYNIKYIVVEMTKIKKLNFVENSVDIINSFKDKELIVYEDIQGSTIYVKWTGEKFIIIPKSLRNEPLNFIDLTTQKFYNKAYEYFNKLPDYVTELLHKNWWFCFEYFPENDSQPANIEYHKVPKNNLIFKCIVKGSKFKFDLEEMLEYSRLFEVDILPVLYYGKLNKEQLEKIQLFLKTSEKDLKFVFGEKNFSKWFYNLLNPDLENSYLMDDNFNDNIEKFVIKIDKDDEYSFEILNPTYNKLEHNNDTSYVDTYSLIILNFVEFLQLQNLSNYKLKSIIKDELYVELISKLFNDYVEEIIDDIEKWVIDIPPFFQDDKFKININFVENKKTKNYLELNPKIEYLFKCILGSFSKKKKKPIGIFNEQTLELFNRTVKDIDNIISNKLSINREHRHQKSDIKNFKEFWDLEFNTDLEGNIYPDVYDLHDDIEGEDKKKKKKKVDFKKPDTGFSIDKEQM
jgi:hypothetical protein